MKWIQIASEKDMPMNERSEVLFVATIAGERMADIGNHVKLNILLKAGWTIKWLDESDPVDKEKKFKKVLEQAISVIKQWHGANDVWHFYYNHAPEMKLIREYLPKSESFRLPIEGSTFSDMTDEEFERWWHMSQKEIDKHMEKFDREQIIKAAQAMEDLRKFIITI